MTDEKRRAEAAAAQILAEVPNVIAAGRAAAGEVGALVALAGYLHRLAQFGLVPVAIVAEVPTPEVRA